MLVDLNAQALIANEEIVQDQRKVSFKENKNKTDKDTYTAVSKSERSSYSVKIASNVSDNQSENFEARESSLVALKVLSSSCNELPFIDDTKGNDASNELNIVTGGSSACGSKQKRILPTVQEYGNNLQLILSYSFCFILILFQNSNDWLKVLFL